MCDFVTVGHPTPENFVASCILQEASVGFAEIHGAALQAAPSSSLAKEAASASGSAGLWPPSRLPLPCYKALGTAGPLIACGGKQLGEQVV